MSETSSTPNHLVKNASKTGGLDMPKVRWGLLSTANINRRVIPAIRNSERGELVAVASRTAATAEAYAAQWDIPLAFSNYQELLDSGEVDAVYISLPNHMHAEWSIKAMQAGVHVLCEKPFALTLQEVDRMMTVSRETGRNIAEALMYRHHAQCKLIGEWVHSGRLGEITLVQASFDYTLTNPNSFRLDPALGGGCLWDVCIYPLSFAQYVMGSAAPEWVLGAQYVGDSGVDSSFTGQLHYQSGAVAQISSSFRTPWRTEAKIMGTRGYLTVTRPFTCDRPVERRLTFHPTTGEPQNIDIPEEYLYLGEVEDMHRVILDGTTNYLSLAETRQHIQTILALYQSAASKQVVYL